MHYSIPVKQLYAHQYEYAMSELMISHLHFFFCILLYKNITIPFFCSQNIKIGMKPHLKPDYRHFSWGMDYNLLTRDFVKKA